MFGRASVLLILGFSMIFTFYSTRMQSFGVTSVDAFSRYYGQTMVNNVAIAGANFACNEFFLNSAWSSGFTNLSIMGGTCNVSVTYLPNNRVQLRSIGTYSSWSDTVLVVLQPSSFAKFGNFYSRMPAYPATGDTFDGPFHVNDNLTTWGTPVFKGKTTSKGSLNRAGSPPNPVFMGGYESGVNIPLSFNQGSYNNYASSGGKIFEGTPSNSFIDVDMTFNADNTVTYKTRSGNSKTSLGSWSASTTTPLTTLTPNGMIYLDKANITVRGTVASQITIVTAKKGGNGMGNITIDNNLVYKDNPLTNPNATNMLGLVAEGSIIVPFNSSRGDMNIQATMYAPFDGLVIDSYSSYPSINSLKILGGLVADETKPTAQYSGSTPVKGYRYVHTFDKRLMRGVPPGYPTTGGFEVLTWLE